MRLTDWHRCKRWNDDLRVTCPYTGSPGHDEDDDREQDEKKRGDRNLAQPDVPIFFAYDWLRRSQETTEVKKPSREVTPIRPPKQLRPVPQEVPGRVAAASTTGGKAFDGNKWLSNFRTLVKASSPARVPLGPPNRNPARSRSPARARSPVRSTFRAASLAATSEKALTTSLMPWRDTAKDWDRGVGRTPQTVMATTRAKATAGGRQRRSNQRRDYRRRIGAAVAATALVGAGVLAARGGGGGGGSHRSAADMLTNRRLIGNVN